MFNSSNSIPLCPHCMRKLKLGGMKFYCVPDEDNRHEVKLSIADRIKSRLPVCRKSFCKNHGLTIRNDGEDSYMLVDIATNAVVAPSPMTQTTL